MDLLKDITRELRGGDESARSDGQTPRASTRPTDAAERATGDSADDESTASPRSDTHVCSFCETEFDADREVCPDCDAEIVFRGAR